MVIPEFLGSAKVADDGRVRAAAWLEAWDCQGLHRTGTAGDAAGAEWLMREAAKLGAAPYCEEFPLSRLDPVAAYLEIEGETIAGVPVFDAPATGDEGIVGALGAVGGDAAIGVAELSPQAVYTPAYRETRRTARHDALVIVCRGAQPGLGLLNAEEFREPYGAPAIHLQSEAREKVFAAAARGAHARFVAASRRTAAKACNVVVRHAGCDLSRRTVVVMTPRSSWWQSTAERGGGLVCWLETLRALLADPPGCEVVFTANSGHELGHLGLDAFLAGRSGWERPTAEGGALWVHYGANLGAAGGSLSVVSARVDLCSQAAAELARHDRPPGHAAPVTAAPSGETRDIHRAGGDYLTLVGTNPFFHLPQDRWPDAVDPPAVADIAAAAARLVVALTR